MGEMRDVRHQTKTNRLIQYIYNVIVSLSDLTYTLMGGSPGVTLSAMLGYRQAFGLETWWSRPLRRFVDWLFRVTLGEHSHCRDSVVGESNVRGLWPLDRDMAKFLADRTVKNIDGEWK